MEVIDESGENTEELGEIEERNYAEPLGEIRPASLILSFREEADIINTSEELKASKAKGAYGAIFTPDGIVHASCRSCSIVFNYIHKKRYYTKLYSPVMGRISFSKEKLISEATDFANKATNGRLENLRETKRGEEY